MLRKLLCTLSLSFGAAACSKPGTPAVDLGSKKGLEGSRSSEPSPKNRLQTLEVVATSTRQWTGIAAYKDRIFVNYPLWSQSQPFAVGELQDDGSVRPYPDEVLNQWTPSRNAKTRFVCVQAMLVHKWTLWVLDPANPRFEGVVKEGPKLMSIDLDTHTLKRIIPLGDALGSEGSYLNDLRIHPQGRHVFMTDSGDGAIVTLDLETGAIRRLLDDHPSTEAEDIELNVQGVTFKLPVHSDGIALSDDGATLYYQALRGRTLWRVSTSALLNPTLSASELAAEVQRVGEVGASDGILFYQGFIYLTSLEHDAIRRVPAEGGEVEIVAQDELLSWPDSFVRVGSSLFVTTAQIHRVLGVKEPPKEPFRILRIQLPDDEASVPTQAAPMETPTSQPVLEDEAPEGAPVLEIPPWIASSAPWVDGANGAAYAVGRASGIKNGALARVTAGNRARAELAKYAESYLGLGDANPVEGMEVVEHWVHPRSGACFALARLKIRGAEAP